MCLFSTRLLAQRRTSCLAPLPSSFIAALYERKPSVVIFSGDPWRLSDFFMKKRRNLIALLPHEALEDLTGLVDRAAQIDHAQYASKLGPKIGLAGGLRQQSSADAYGKQTRTIPWF